MFSDTMLGCPHAANSSPWACLLRFSTEPDIVNKGPRPRAPCPHSVMRPSSMSTRHIRHSLRWRITLACILAAGCHSYPGGPVLPRPSDDAVGVGYGTQDKRDVTGAVG